MRLLRSLPKNSLALMLVIAVLPSCVDPNLLQTPVIISEPRQKKNYYYIPTSVNAPMLVEKNSLSSSIQGSFGSHPAALELQAAYVPISHLGLVTSFSSGGKIAGDLEYHRIAAGAGYIGSFNKYWHAEIYGGYTAGKINNRHSTGSSSIRNNGFFLQPTFFYYNEKKNIQLGLAGRLTGNHFNIVSASFLSDLEPYTKNQFDLMANKPFQLFFEPAIIFRFGWNNFLFHTSFSYASNLTTPDLNYPSANFSLGAYLKFNTAMKTAKPGKISL